MRVKVLIKVLVGIFLLQSVFAAESPSSLENELQRLKMPDNVAPSSLSKEKLYSFQTRYSRLEGRHELSLGAGHNFTPDNHLTSRRLDLSYRYHLTDRWTAQLNGFKAFNELNSSGKNLVFEKAVIPATDFQKSGFAVSALYNLIYGKFRFGLEKAHYFDHYIGAGIGQIQLSSGSSPMLQLETGLSFWLGKWGSLRFGLKDELHKENRGPGERVTHNFIGLVNFGFMFGGKAI